MKTIISPTVPKKLASEPYAAASSRTAPDSPLSRQAASAPAGGSPTGHLSRRATIIAVFSTLGIILHLILRFALHTSSGVYDIPLQITIALGGLPLLYDLACKVLKGAFGSDLLAGISIVTALLLGEYLAGSIIVVMLSGGAALESYALQNASSVLAALAKRMPSIAHRKKGAEIQDIGLGEVAIGDTLVIYPNEICPADGEVIEGHGSNG